MATNGDLRLEPAPVQWQPVPKVGERQVALPTQIISGRMSYPVMSGGGIFGNDKDELYPIQRFFNLQQLASTPVGLKFIPVKNNKKDLTVAALGDSKTGQYAVHIVNKGATKTIELSVLSEGVKSLNLYLTNKDNNFKKGAHGDCKRRRCQF